MVQLYLIRGLPGSGKSTLAKLLCNSFEGAAHFEADQYFVDRDGVYRFDPSLLKDAHGWCLDNARLHLREGRVVIVSNTFTRIWEMQPYLDLGCKTQVIACEGNFGNVHGVPEAAIERMRSRWEAYAG